MNNYFGVLQGVLHNLGVGILPDYVTQDFPDLVRVLPDIESADVPVFLAYPEELRQSKRISAFKEFVQEEIIAYRKQLRDNRQSLRYAHRAYPELLHPVTDCALNGGTQPHISAL